MNKYYVSFSVGSIWIRVPESVYRHAFVNEWAITMWVYEPGREDVMRKWLKRKFDNTPPHYGFLSNAESTMMEIAIAIWFATLIPGALGFIPTNWFIAVNVFFCLAALAFPFFSRR